MQAGYKVGTLTSPHLLSYNERIAINAQPVDDEQIVQSFECIDKVRGDISLTYFEFNTLAAVDIFQKNQVDVMILEIGLGGRLDAVNIFDADCSIVTSIDLDHQHFLGDTIEEIAFEKAGVYRAGKSAICGQNPSPTSLKNYAYEIGAELLEFKKNFNFQKIDGNEWVFSWNQKNTDPGIYILPMPALLGDYQLNNASCALMAIVCLQEILPVKLEEIKQGLLLVRNP